MIKKIAKHKGTQEFARFAIVGIINTCANYLVYLFSLKILDIYYIISGIFGFLVGATTAFLLNRKWTFKSNVALKKGFAKYLLIQCFCLLIHVLIQFYVTEMFNLKEEYSQLPSIVVTMFINFFLIRKFVFHQRIL